MNCVVEILVPHTTRLNLAPLVYSNVEKLMNKQDNSI